MIIMFILIIAILTIGWLYWFVQECLYCYKDDDGIYRIETDKFLWIMEGMFLFFIVCPIIINCLLSAFPIPALYEWELISDPKHDVEWCVLSGVFLTVVVVSHIVCVLCGYFQCMLNKSID